MQEAPPAHVFNIQKYSIYDGPGIRTLIFFQGCPLRCLWCSNPEGLTPAPKILFSHKLCAHCGNCVPVCPERLHTLSGNPPRHEFRHEGCTGCGACAKACLQHALTLSGKLMSTEDLLNSVLEDRDFYETSGGGLTVGGGEPLMQWQAVYSLLKACRSEGIHTAMETSGQATTEIVAQIAPLVDLFLYDIKHMDEQRHRELTGVGNETILKNVTWLLNNGYSVRVRLPLINGYNADEDELRALAAFLSSWQNAPNFKGVDLLPYHRFGVQKYECLGMPYPVDARALVSNEQLSLAQAIFEKEGLSVACIRH